MRRPHLFGHREKSSPRSGDALSRRQFLTRAAQVAAGGLVTTQLAACGDRGPLELAGPALVEAGGRVDGPLFYPEDFALAVRDAARAINRALAAALDVQGTVLLGRDYSEYHFRSHVWVQGGTRPVTLRGLNAEIKLLNAGGVGFDGRPSRILMRRMGVLRDLHIAPAGELEPAVPGIDAGGDADDGSSDLWMVDNCQVQDFPGNGINFGNYSSHVTITGNRIYNNGIVGVQLNTHCNSSRLANNTVSRNARNGLDCNGNNNIIEYNLCTENGTYEGTSDRNGILVAGILGLPSNGNIVRYNRCLRNQRCGIFLGGETMRDTKAIGNEANENENAGIMVEALTHSNRNEALVVVDNRLNSNGYFGFAENGAGTISYTSFSGNTGSNNEPGLILRSNR